MKYYFAISDTPRPSPFGGKRHILVWNTRKSSWLDDRELPRWLDNKLSSLGWEEMCEAYCARNDDGTSKDLLIKAIEAAIPEMEYSNALEDALEDV